MIWISRLYDFVFSVVPIIKIFKIKDRWGSMVKYKFGNIIYFNVKEDQEWYRLIKKLQVAYNH